MNEFKNFFADFCARAQVIADLMLASVITDTHQLTVALAVSGLEEIAETLSNAADCEACYVAAHMAVDIGWNPSVRSALAEKGYFTEGLRGLLELAEADPVVGSRLVPVFDEAASVHNDLGIPKALKHKLREYTKKKLESDGFVIGRRDEDGKIRVKTAGWVNKKVEKAFTQTDDEV